jgi:AcrR family transcriptional regulator
VGRPREHDERTRSALLAVAERLVAEGGPDALSVRAVADEADKSTRAVYSLFGSKDGLVSALAQQAFEFLEAGLVDLKETDDPASDLIEVGMVFRRFVLTHPSLYRIAFQRIVPGLRVSAGLAATRERVFGRLLAKTARLGSAGLLDRKSVHEAATEFNAMSEGMANAELRGEALRILPEGKEARAWRNALLTVVHGFTEPGPPRRAGQRARPRRR